MKKVAHAALLLLLTYGALAAAYASGGVAVKNAWARATAPGQSTAGAYMEIVSAERAAVVGVKSAVAKRAEIHSSSMQDGIMRMRAVDRIELPAKEMVSLSPGGLHIMLIDIARPLYDKEKLPLDLVLESAGGARSTLRVNVTVRAAGTAPHRHAH
ncbi:MAG: copper chaperone PCu(A)C [Betaproteobacteria bacterium]